MLPVPADFRDRPFTLAEAQAQGLTRRALGGPRFTRVFRGVYVSASLDMGLRAWLLAVLLAGPADAVISHRSALAWYGLDLRGGGDATFHVSTRQNAVCRDERIRVHRRLHPISARDVRGLPVTSPERTFVDCATQFTLVQLVATADWLIAGGLSTRGRLAAYCNSRHLDGVAAARRALEHVGPESRSPMESFVRMLMQFGGLPVPRCNVDVRDGCGVFLACTDFAWPAFKVAVEYDGRWHDDQRQRVRDRDRREYLESQGWIVIVVVDRDVRVPIDILRRIHRRLAERGYTGQPPQLSFDDAALFGPGAF